jgi:hypothetical protein
MHEKLMYQENATIEQLQTSLIRQMAEGHHQRNHGRVKVNESSKLIVDW